MNKLKTFWYVFKRSLTSPEYYADLLKTSFGFSLQYLFFLLFLILFVRGAIFSVSLLNYLPRLPEYVSEAKTILHDFYPNELVLTIRDGSLRTNVDEPYTIPFPKSMNLHDYSFAVIDTKSSVENIKKYKTFLFVTKDAIAYPDSNSTSGYKVQFLSDMKGYSVINRQAYDQILSKITPYFQYATPFVVGLIIVSLFLLPLFGSAFYLSTMLLYLIFLTIMVYILCRVQKKPLDFGSLYRLSMHGITFSLLFDVLKSFFGISIPFTFVMPYLIWMMIVFNSMKLPYGTNNTPASTA